MLRHQRRFIKKSWNKIKCFVVYNVFESKTMFEEVPFTAVDVFMKTNDDMLFRWALSYSKIWRLMVYYVVDGFPRCLGYDKVGVASEEWLDDYFGHSDDDFEDFR